MRVVVVDDEEPARDRLLRLLKHFPVSSGYPGRLS
jgi:hypothetical protein